MNRRVVARAPGKLFLLGEYAVLDGCPAVVAAIDRYVEVTLECTRATTTYIRTQGYGQAEFPTADPPTVRGPLQFVTAAWRASLRRVPAIGQLGAEIRIVSRLADSTGPKVGLGSSAAVTVATVAALLAAAGKRLDREELFAVALEAHRSAQNGLGSGADIAASVWGGLTSFQPRNGSLSPTAHLMLPPDTALLAAWTGEAASTAGLVQRYLASSNGAAATRAAFVEASRDCVDEFVKALAQGAPALSAIDRNGDLLETLGNALHLPLFTPRLRQLVAIAREHGAAAKISGAGSGDCGIALTHDAAAAQRIRRAWQAAGLLPLDLHVSAKGVTVADS